MALTKDNAILASDMNTVSYDLNTMSARYGQTQSAPGMDSTSHLTALSSLIAGYKTQLTNANNHSYCSSKQDLTGVANYDVGKTLVPSLISTIKTKRNAIYNAYCSCNCNNCSCNCDNCWCNCDNCYCDCDRYSCYCACSGGSGSDQGSYHTCLLPDQLIYTTNGVKLITEVQDGEYVIGMTDNGEVYATWEMDYSDLIYKINTNSCSIHLTGQHVINVFDTTLGEVQPISAVKLFDDNFKDKKLIVPKLFGDKKTMLLKENLTMRIELLEIMPYLYKYAKVQEDSIVVVDENRNFQKVIDVCREYIDLNYSVDGNVLTIKDNPLNKASQSVIKLEKLLGIAPNWLYQFDKETIVKYLEFVTEETKLVFDNRKDAYAVRLLFMSTGTNVRVVDGEEFKIEIVGQLEEFEEFYGMDVESIDTYSYEGKVYNLVTSNNNYVIEILSGDLASVKEYYANEEE